MKIVVPLRYKYVVNRIVPSATCSRVPTMKRGASSARRASLMRPSGTPAWFEEQLVRETAAEKTGAAGDDDTHRSLR